MFTRIKTIVVYIVFLASFACAGLFLPSVSAQKTLLPNEPKTIYRNLTIADFKRVISAFPEVKNFRKEDMQGNKNRSEVYSFTINDTKLAVMRGPKSLQLNYGLKGVVSYESTNSLNMKVEFARVSRVNDLMVIQSELETTGGVSTAAIREWVRTFIAVRRFVKKELSKDQSLTNK